MPRICTVLDPALEQLFRDEVARRRVAAARLQREAIAHYLGGGAELRAAVEEMRAAAVEMRATAAELRSLSAALSLRVADVERRTAAVEKALRER